MSLEASLGRLADGLIGRIDAILADYVSRVRVEVPDFFAPDEQMVVEATRESARAGFVTAFKGLGATRDVPHSAPGASAAEARLAAELGLPIELVLTTNDVGHSTAWEHILDEVDCLGLDTGSRRALLQITTRYTFAYVERLGALVTDEFTRARSETMRSSARRRARLVQDLLAGLPANEEALGYPLACWHLGAIAWGERPAEAIRELSSQLEGVPMAVAGPLGTLWGWVAIATPDADRSLASYASPPATRLALGTVGQGRAGFRRSHQQAHAARVVALRTTDAVTRWRNVALEALALRDEDAARAFVRDELGTLVSTDPRSRVLRQTLAAWFRSDQRLSSAAAALGVHERTVTYRLRSIEERLGHAIRERRTELDAALRLHEHCGLGDSSPPLSHAA